MSTLASEYLKSAHKNPHWDRLTTQNKTLLDLQLWTHDFVLDRLKAPIPGSDLRLAASQCAERYVFDEDAPTITRALVDSGAITNALVFDSMRLPASNIWIEYPLEDQTETDIMRIGLMVGSVPRNDTVLAGMRTMLAIVGQTKTSVAVVGLMTLPEGPVILGKTKVDLHWFLHYLAGSKSSSEADHDCKMFVYDLIDCLFLINTPRVCEMRESSFGSNRKVRPKDKPPLPLVEYKRVLLKVGVGTPQYKKNGNVPGVETDEARHRRLHRVVGHFRTYREGRAQPKVSFVPQHWRGDAELGILLHEREVKR
jgi:hypothetical protein